MSAKKTADKLLEATIHLLETSETPSKITARDIAKVADVNLAMINYCYDSKDQLIATAIDKIIEEDFVKLYEQSAGQGSTLEKLTQLMQGICETVFRYEEISRISMPYLLLEKKIEVPLMILPLVSACFKGKKTEAECKIIAYEMVSFLQLVFYQRLNFKEYTGIDLTQKEEREKLISMQLALFFS
ncbi:TetR family transcriptional regulator [Sporanaerobium hydrogeniformans]|uniref:TetR family transcriptional regulator n=1 Tax=Sporanaerobium hydrogeniformans TaxID=3072179 RepID=A0AC61D957_9FIRM|nr:TetR/AcrR family transcriptional regulator [Sporanaerobium hydrogeniformans]PHV69909.1 TetR family transcriptional regulator [Sporanaerobium hydrogeniformans]